MSDDDERTTIIPADGRCKAIVYYWLGPGEPGEPAYDLSEHPIIAWRMESTGLEDAPMVAVPVLAACFLPSHGMVATLYEDGRVVDRTEIFDNREAFAATCTEFFEHREKAKADRASVPHGDRSPEKTACSTRHQKTER